MKTIIKTLIIITLLILTIAPTTLAQTTQPATPQLRPLLSPQAKNQAARKLIDQFIKHVQASPTIDATAKQTLSQAWKQFRQDENPQDFLPAGIAIISESIKTAIDAIQQENYKLADKNIRPLLQSKNPYIKLHAQAMLAQSLVEQGNQQAENILTPLIEQNKELREKSFLETETTFLLGYCQLANLHYQKALTTLTEFTRNFPDAPEQLLLPAQQMLQELQLRQPERLGDVTDLMYYAARRLNHRFSGDSVQSRQQRAIELLSNLVKEAEQQEQSCNGNCGKKGCKKCKGGGSGRGAGGEGGSPAGESTLPGGKGDIGSLHRSPNVKPGDAWGNMRPEQREKILQSLRKNFPSRYRQLVEQYYKQLAKER